MTNLRRGESSRNASARHRIALRLHQLGLNLVQRKLCLAVPLFERRTQHDPPHPALQRPLTAELRPRPVRTSKSLLHRITRALVVATHGRDRVPKTDIPLPIQPLDRPTTLVHHQIEARTPRFL